MKISFSVLLFLLVLISSAQENKSLKGQFIGDNLEKSFINVININQAKATISQLDGKFEIQAKVGDSILISSIQYKEVKFIVKSEYFDETIEIPLKLEVNELEQVNLYSIGLTGNLETDAKNIRTEESQLMNLGGFDISKAYDEGVTTQSDFTYRNVAMEQNPIPASVNIKAVYKLLSNALRSKKGKKNTTALDIKNSSKLSDKDFIVDFLEIEVEDVGQFIAYAKSKGLTGEMLKKENELDLIQFLISVSKDFKAEYGK